MRAFEAIVDHRTDGSEVKQQESFITSRTLPLPRNGSEELEMSVADEARRLGTNAEPLKRKRKQKRRQSSSSRRMSVSLSL
jgi:hypothetical protein